MVITRMRGIYLRLYPASHPSHPRIPDDVAHLALKHTEAGNDRIPTRLLDVRHVLPGHWSAGVNNLYGRSVTDGDNAFTADQVGPILHAEAAAFSAISTVRLSIIDQE